MNRIITLVASLCLALTVSACGQTAPAGVSASTPAGESTGAADSAMPQGSVSETGREKQTILSMEVEGQTEEVPATLYEGEGYSIYIPDGEWTSDVSGRWEAEANGDVEIEVEYYSGKKQEEAAEVIRTEWNGYELIDAEYGDTFSGADSATGKYLDAYLTETAGGVFAVLCQYPEEAAEGFGTRMSAIAGTFAPNE